MKNNTLIYLDQINKWIIFVIADLRVLGKRFSLRASGQVINIKYDDYTTTGGSTQPHHIVMCYHINRSQNSGSDFRLSVCYHTHHTNVKSDCTRRRMTGITAKPLTDDNEKCHCLKMEFFFHKKGHLQFPFAQILVCEVVSLSHWQNIYTSVFLASKL